MKIDIDIAALKRVIAATRPAGNAKSTHPRIYVHADGVACPGCMRRGMSLPCLVAPGQQCNACADREEGTG